MLSRPSLAALSGARRLVLPDMAVQRTVWGVKMQDFVWLVKRNLLIIIIIFHVMHAACRLWRSYLHVIGSRPIVSFILHCFSSSILARSSSFVSLVSSTASWHRNVVVHSLNRNLKDVVKSDGHPRCIAIARVHVFFYNYMLT